MLPTTRPRPAITCAPLLSSSPISVPSPTNNAAPPAGSRNASTPHPAQMITAGMLLGARATGRGASCLVVTSTP
ncbi:Uncharacterised protein [Mycobacteroides abscessus subsp. abscessus]|nr:Uncharacterised protein [Mycobacteroides abscessus subsp. abscessus]